MLYVILIFVLMAIISFRPLVKQRLKKDIIVTIIVFAVTLAICLMQVGGVNIPSPTVALGELVKSIGLSYPPLK